jgi:O-antigen/teichoic acid export membrane protein/glycosyltransferase involved in cell wall biosynthesis
MTVERRLLIPGPDGSASLRVAGIAVPLELVAYAIKAVNVGASFLVTLVLARWAGAEAFGFYAFAVATASLLGIVALAGQDQVLVRQVAGDLRQGLSADAHGAVLRSVKLVLPRAVVVMAVYGGVVLLLDGASWFNSDRATMAVAAYLVLFNAMTRLGLALVRGSGHPLWAQIFEGLHNLPLALLLLGLAAFGTQPISAPFAVILLVLALASSTLINWRRIYGMMRGWGGPNAVTGNPARQGLPFMLVNFVHLLTEWLPLALITMLVSAADAGAFRAAAQIVLLSGMVVATGEIFVNPQFAGDFRAGRVDLAWQRYRRASLFMALAAGPILLLALFAPGFLMRTLFGAEFGVAAAALPILALGQAVNVVTGPVGGLVAMAGRERLLLLFGIVALVILAVLALLLVPPYGILGAAIAAASATVFRNGATYVLARRIVADGRLRATDRPGEDRRPLALILGSLPYAERGPSYTAGVLAEAMDRPPLAVTVHAATDIWVRRRPRVEVVTSAGGPVPVGAAAGWRLDPDGILARHEARIAALAEAMPAETIVYLFGEQPASLSERLHARGIRVVREKINAGKAMAKAIYDREREATGYPVTQEITEEACAKEAREMALADAVFCPSPMVAESMRYIGVPEEKLLHSSYGWDPLRLRGSHRSIEPASVATFLYVGYLAFHKGAHILIEAWERAGIDGRLLLAGQFEPAFKALFGERLRRPDIRHLGYVKDIGAVYRSADWFLFPSIAEGGPQVTYEAGGCRLPAIVTRMGAGAFTRDGIDGLILDTHDPDVWADAIQRAASGKLPREAMADAALARSAEFTWDRVGAKRVELLRAKFGF